MKVPSLLPENLTGEVKYTPKAKLKYGEIDWNSIFMYDSFDLNVVSTMGESPFLISRYKLMAVAKGEIIIENTADPIEYVLFNGQDSEIYIPVKNLYGNPLPIQIKFIEVQTGNLLVLNAEMSEYERQVYRGTGRYVNHLAINAWALPHLLPGAYHVELTMNDNSVLKMAKPIIVKSGPMTLIQWPMIAGPTVKPGDTLRIKGHNLLEHTIDVELIDSLDRSFAIQELEFGKYGEFMNVIIPQEIKFGPYAVRLIQKNNLARPFCFGTKVSDRQHEPLEIFRLLESEGTCEVNRKPVLSRGAWLGVSVNYFDGKGRFKLVPVGDVSKSYIAEAIIFSHRNFEGEPAIFIPQAVPPGFYRITLQSLDGNKEVTQEGPPFWKVVEIQ
ncbi:hypothetical protein [Dyadobacter sp. CY312]|uniref:hypothetical protein n=1 Tax=Dyadobacter sp. CY312 TaxID=2907303 RepID=UPI001F2E0807|nr:hypothetical protein [Dyadobacter sp. CY312]MCE7043822.1 hypothetical protein [Dyadobacter sp. CY312]